LEGYRMGYAVELYFDDETTRRVATLTGQIHARCGGLDLLGQNFQPHLSLAGYETVDSERMTTILHELAKEQAPLEIQLGAVGLFPTSAGVVYLAPVVTQALLALHAKFQQQAAAAGIISHPYYQVGAWIPHCTVAHELAFEQLGPAVELCLQSQLFGSGQLVGLGLLEYLPARPLMRVPFSNAEGS